jgi:hypothetical protein
LSQQPRLKFFQGSSQDLDGLHDQIADWLESGGATPLNYSCKILYSTIRRRWVIFAVVLYVKGPITQQVRSQIAVPGLSFTPN